jgi:hypothetical protein
MYGEYTRLNELMLLLNHQSLYFDETTSAKCKDCSAGALDHEIGMVTIQWHNKVILEILYTSFIGFRSLIVKVYGVLPS